MTNSDGGKGSDRRPTDEKTFASNYNAIFGDKKPTRGSFVYCKERGELVPKDEYYSSTVSNAPMIQADIAGYQSQVTGEWIGSRSTHRQHLKEHRLIEVGNEIKAHTTKQAPRVDRERLRRDIAESLNRHGY
jgi:hypothetical protein